MPFRYTLLADGSSDAALLRVIDWVLARQADEFPELDLITPSFHCPRDLGIPENNAPPLSARVRMAMEKSPCDLLFVHRDAEGASREKRLEEILAAVQDNSCGVAVPVVPVRMTEAWLLIDEAAIREAAGNPNGRIPLRCPGVGRLESLPDPKEVLYDCLKTASELGGRRLKKFQRDLKGLRVRVAAAISDFSPPRRLSAFEHFEKDTVAALLAISG